MCHIVNMEKNLVFENIKKCSLNIKVRFSNNEEIA